MSGQASQNTDKKSEKIISGVAERYATALFGLCLEENKLKEVEKDLVLFSKLVADNKDLQHLINSPIFSSHEQISALSVLFKKAGFKGHAANLVMLAAKNRRLFAIQDIISAFHQLLALHRGEINAEIITAQELSKTQIDELKTALRKNLSKEIGLSMSVDTTLLGGLIIKIGSRMIDTSLRTKLNSLKIVLKEVS